MNPSGFLAALAANLDPKGHLMSDMSPHAQLYNDRLVAQWRAKRVAVPLNCQASIKDGECVHRNCPAQRGRLDCPLPWAHRLPQGGP